MAEICKRCLVLPAVFVSKACYIRDFTSTSIAYQTILKFVNSVPEGAIKSMNMP